MRRREDFDMTHGGPLRLSDVRLGVRRMCCCWSVAVCWVSAQVQAEMLSDLPSGSFVYRRRNRKCSDRLHDRSTERKKRATRAHHLAILSEKKKDDGQVGSCWLVAHQQQVFCKNRAEQSRAGYPCPGCSNFSLWQKLREEKTQNGGGRDRLSKHTTIPPRYPGGLKLKRAVP